MKKLQNDKADYQSDILDLSRKILQGVRLNDVDFADKLKGQERINFLKFCSETANNIYFEQIFSMLYFPQIMAAATKAPDYDTVCFHRATCNGISLAKEFFEKYARQYDVEYGPKEEPVDPHKAFTSVDSLDFYKV